MLPKEKALLARAFSFGSGGVISICDSPLRGEQFNYDCQKGKSERGKLSILRKPAGNRYYSSNNSTRVLRPEYNALPEHQGAGHLCGRGGATACACHAAGELMAVSG